MFTKISLALLISSSLIGSAAYSETEKTEEKSQVSEKAPEIVSEKAPEETKIPKE